MMTTATHADDKLRPILAVLGHNGTTTADAAVRVYGQASPAAIERTLEALRQLEDLGMARLEHAPLAAFWHRTDEGNRWLVADPGRVKFGAGMINYGD